MKINVRGDKVVVTDSINKYIEEKIGRLEKYFENKDIEAKIIIRVRNNEQIIEVTIPTNKYTLRREEKNEDLYAAIDLVVDKLERQIRKNKTKLNDRYKKENFNDFNFSLIEALDEKEIDKDLIVKRKELEIKPMDEEEAILQMNLINHDFFVFKNIKTDSISVIYKRKDGKFGIINTK